MELQKPEVIAMPTYTLGCQRQISAANYIYYADGCPHPDRIMQEHDFVYMINGEWEILQNEVPFTAMNDDVFILHAGQHHSGNKNCTPGTRTIYFHISCSPQDSFIGNAPFHGSTLPPLIHCSSFPRVKLLFQELISVRLSPSPNKDRKINALFDLLLLELQDSCAQNSHTQDTLLTQAITLTAQNPQKFYKTSDMALLLGVCPKTLNQRFREAYAKTFYQYQMEEKIHLVQQFLLDYPDSKLQTVALNFGFYDEFHLNKIFKKHTGTPPGLYRKTLTANTLRPH